MTDTAKAIDLIAPPSPAKKKRRILRADVHVDEYVTVDIDLAELDTADLLAELRERDDTAAAEFTDAAEQATKRAFEAYGRGDLRTLDAALRDLFDSALGRVAGASPFEVHA